MKYLTWIQERIFPQTPHRPQYFHFLHIGKTGGTAIVHALNQQNCCIPSPRRMHMKAPDIYHLNALAEDSRMVIYIHPHDENLRQVPVGEKVFFFLRDPVSRFTSGFYSRQRQGQPRYNNPWTDGERVTFERFHTTQALALALSSADREEKAAAEKAMKSIQHVLIPYATYFESEEYLCARLTDIFFVGFQETLTHDFEKLKARLDLPGGLQLPSNDVLAHKNPAHVEKNLTEQAIYNLKTWYANDYRLIELCRELFA